MARKNKTAAQVQSFVAARSPRAARPSDTNTVDWDELDDPIEDSADVAAAMAGRNPDGDLTERDLLADLDEEDEVEGEDFELVEVGENETDAPFESAEDEDEDDAEAPMFWYASEADARWFCDHLTTRLGEQMYVVELYVKGERRLYVMSDADISAGGHGDNVLSGSIETALPA